MPRGYVGERIARVDSPDKVTGKSIFPADLYFDGMLHANVLWSEYPHARILGIDASAARAYPGVVAVLTAEDVPVNEYGIHIMDQRVLAQDKVRS
ncbi:MAG: xanthine dehydrogenase, partial [Chloroflexi bacterium]|nr:xanthine dehydrogenase [Chloroflexota bacterium]